jgi:hypothetical protein
MDKLIRISYKSEAIQPHKNLTESMDDFEISNSGGYNYLFVDYDYAAHKVAVPSMLIGRVSEAYFQKFNDIFPDSIFDPAFPDLCKKFHR